MGIDRILIYQFRNSAVRVIEQKLERGEVLYRRFKWCFFNRSFNYVLRQLTAFSALACHTELFTNIFKCSRTTIYKFLDLAVGNSFAKTNVHG